MARHVIERQLSSRQSGDLRFAVAARDDDAEIRRLLRDHPTPGDISLTFEREPDYFADAGQPGESKQTIVARQGSRVVCTGSCTIRWRFVSGVPHQVGYLGGLRLDDRLAGRFDVLRRGYEFFHELQTESPADVYFTSIAADNLRARAFLERNLPGMPAYKFVGEFATILISTRGRASTRSNDQSSESSWQELAARLNDHNRQFQLAPHWDETELAALQNLGLNRGDFCFVHEGGRVVASAALWDQRSFKQTVVRDYGPRLKAVRPALNVFSRLTQGTRFPVRGETLANAYGSHVVAEASRPDSLVALVSALLGLAAHRRIEMLTLGFAANDPRLAVLRKVYKFREYRTRIYRVRWPGDDMIVPELESRILAPETALL